MKSRIKLSHGDGGKNTDMLIKDIFHKYFKNDFLVNGLDSAIVNSIDGKIAFTTDSFVVSPIFFPGGDIGKLAVYGTVNDLVVSLSKPLYLSCSFIIEEGFEIEKLKTIVKSMADACIETKVKIITGDTKVVEKGSVDGIFINTSGIGVIDNSYKKVDIKEEDKVIITGNIGDHGTTIAIERYDLDFRGNIKSDCGSLLNILEELKEYSEYIKLMKDPTRGGLGTALNEIADYCDLGIEIVEDSIPISNEVLSVSEILGLDPLYLANEGRAIIVVEESVASTMLKKLRKIKGCENSNIVGTFKKDINKSVYMKTTIGGKRIMGKLEEQMVPRIC